MHSPVSKPTQKGNLSHLQQEGESIRKNFLFYCWANVENAVSWHMNIRTLLQRRGTKKGFLFLLFASLCRCDPGGMSHPSFVQLISVGEGLLKRSFFIRMQKNQSKKSTKEQRDKKRKKTDMF